MTALKIVLLDDDPDILEAMKNIVDNEGYESKGLTKWEELKGTLERFKPNMLVLDMKLRGNDGLKIARSVRKNKLTRNIPILMISAFPGAEKEATGGGIDGFLPKPFELNDFLEAINKLISGRGGEIGLPHAV